MYRTILYHRWDALKERARLRWPRLTARDVEQVEGSHDELSWSVQLRYGLSKTAADIEIGAWLQGVSGETELQRDARTTSGHAGSGPGQRESGGGVPDGPSAQPPARRPA